MKTASWSLTLAAGTASVLANTPASYSGTPAEYLESSSSPAPPVKYGPSSGAAPSGFSSSSLVSSVSSWASSSSSISAVPVSSSSAPAGYPSSPVENITTTKYNTKTVCPCEFSSVTPEGPTRTPGEVYTIHFTTEYETVCPGDAEISTFTYGDAWTSIYTKSKMTTTTEVITHTVTEPTTSTSQAIGNPGGYPVPSGSSPLSPPYPYPSGHPSSTGTASSPSGTGSCVPCQGQPDKNPKKWCGYTIHDNWYQVMPKTCKTVEYHWTLEEIEVSPDGVTRHAQAVNGQIPGPAIEANWGDTIIVHLTNNLPQGHLNGTSLHFHGIRQNGTNEYDGVSSITQCPTPPGSSMTYKFEASSYGTSWWHSHYGLQTYDGMFGPIIIHGPASAKYDDDQMVMLQDWNHISVDVLYGPSQEVGNPASGPQTLDTGLINGMNIWPETGKGKRFEMTVTKGKSYRLRLVNTAIQSTFVFYVDGHQLDVIGMDLVPIKPYTTDKVVINIGQRYDIILKANQESGDYWMRSDNQQPCAQLRNLDIRGIVHYADGPMSEPQSQAYEYAPTCLDEPYEKLNPIVPWSAGSEDYTIDKSAFIGPGPSNPTLFKWTLSGTTFYAEWEHPTLKQIYQNGTIPTTSGNLAIEVPELHEWVYVIIETVIPLPHPIHLHGHDFLILAQGLGVYDESVPLNLENPPRRDVANMPADPTNGQPGYLVMAFQTSNPGVWLLHCHIGWHNAMGMALQIIEDLEGISDTVKHGGMIEENCNAWTAYAAQYNIMTSDSGV